MGHWCHVARGQPACCDECVIGPYTARGKDGDRRNRLCPCHDDEHASLSINPGTEGMWLVWNCKAGCDATDIREALLARGAHPDCLGSYGDPERTRSRNDSASGRGTDPRLIADAGRWNAIAKLAGTKQPKLSEHLLRMCIQAIAEGDGNLPGDPFGLLPVNQDDFVDLASRTGIERSHRHKLYKRWLAY